MRTRTLAAMKLSYRSVSRLWRYWSGPSALRGSFTSWENAPESEADRSPAAPIQQQQFAAQSDHSGAIPETRPRAIRKLLREFGSSSSVKRVAEDHLLTGSAFTEVLKSFEDYVFFREHPDVVRIIDSLLSNEGHVDDLLPYFLEYAREKNPLIGPVLELSLTSNLSRPTNWYPWARALQRRIYYHAGPTNSGKTHAAIQRLKAAGSGIYCAPLRMLAHEIFHRCNQEGIACDLRTGEETQFASGDEGQLAPHLSCTVEMVPNIGVDHSYDVAVIDEIQMIEDASRGGAWTRALIGVPAREIHVCGNGSAVDLVERLASLMNEQLEVISYDRLVPLEVDESSLDGNYSAVRPGDCVIVFSRRKLFDVRRRIAAATGQRCAAVYGSLPPATRVQQAQLFNDPQSDCQVMVATDAVGMGLNLNIRRIVFHDVKKYDGEDCRPLTSAHAKQIAGRAGRYGLNHSSGLVTTFHRNHLEQLKALMSAPIESIKQAGLYPSPEHIKIFSSHLPHAKLPDILMMFERMAQVDENYFLCDMGEQKSVASKLTFAPLTIMDHFVFSKAPVDSANNIEITAIREFAKMYASGQPVVYEHLVKMIGLRGKPGGVANISQLAMIEDYHKVTDIYLWLSMRFPECFSDAERVRQLQSDLGTAIGDSLAISSAKLGRRHPHLQDIDHTEMQRLVTYFWSSKGKRKHNNMQALAKIIRDSRRKKTRYGFVNKRNMKRKF